VTRFHNTHRGERVQASAHGRPADADFCGEIAFRGQPVSRTKLSAFDKLPDVSYNLLGTSLSV
jgi:hypothetical protein